MTVRRPTDVWPKFLVDEYRRLAKLPVPPVEMIMSSTPGDMEFICRPNPDPRVQSWYFSHHLTGQDYAGLMASLAWVKEGPKIVDVTEEQFQALSQIEVRLGVRDFAMPYPTILVNLPPGRMHGHIILHRTEVACGDSMVPVLIGASMSASHVHDIVTACRDLEGRMVEDSLRSYTDEVSADEAEATHAAMRVACNMALAMTSFGFMAEHLFPGELERDRKTVTKGRARPEVIADAEDRIRESPVLLTLDRTVRLYQRHSPRGEPGEPTGRQMPFHWRKGHWRMQPCGPGRAERRRILIKPCMVRADLLGDADPMDTTTVYA